MRHLHTGITVDNTETRSQHKNRENAMRILKSHLYEIELQKKREKQAEVEGSKMKIEWGSQIRNYVLHPYKMVKDLRTDHEHQGSAPVQVSGENLHFLLEERGLRAGDDQQVALPWRETHQFRAEAADVVVRRHRAHELDGTSGHAEGQRPQTVFPTPIDRLPQTSCEKIAGAFEVYCHSSPPFFQM